MWSARNRLILIMLIAGGMLNYADRQIIAVLKPMLQHSLHWTDGDYGHMTAIFQFASAIALLGSGWVVDRIGWRAANPLAVGSWSLAAMAHAFTRTLGQFTVARVALGATEAFGTPTAIKTIAAIFRNEERSLALGVMNAANTVGAIVTPLIIPWLAAQIGWAKSFLVTGGLGLVWVAVWFIAAPAKSYAPPPSTTPAAPREKVRWSVVLSDRRTWAVAGAKVLSDQVWWLLLFWMPDLFHRLYHLTPTAFGAPLAVIYACAAVGSMVAGFASTRALERGVSLNATRKFSLLTAALLVTPLWLVLLAPNYWVATAILGLALAAHQGFSVNVFALATDVSPAPRVATVISLGAFCGNMAGAAILQAAGWAMTKGHGYAPLLAFASISYLLGVGWVHLLLPRIVAADPEPEAVAA